MNKLETLSEIFAVISILIKFESEDIIEDENLFIAFINELGIRNNGKLFNRSNLKSLIKSLTEDEKKQLIEEFNMGHKSTYSIIEMHLNRG
ncbi:anti-sigma factor [Proteus phage phiP4-3]|uniref:Anti-sigma 70 protein n=1 Tax=Proteus phage phiP4-3 TaxID=2065203 RepID=A0A2I6PF68_9CAUD|nr:anti-sigma factor [Proteus phage phiP4-3]AUM58367.1 anti-sigma 70 protein [Proteus phage phiP4-3]AZV01380.1 anti-sigma 70 protein [Shigella phage vB_SdyM_006]